MKKLSDAGSLLDIPRCCQVLDILANAKRLEVVFNLYLGELCVTELAHCVGISQSALSQHLAKMREAGVVASRREGVVVYYRLAMPEVMGVLEEVTRFLGNPPLPFSK
ncbi:metalloregulator ArsR/SmtB family transcription factor [Agrobacterium sp. LAD9]|uniref:ArsR/SmtB family transcription factor n=1 Tax=Agrobacterium sp. LAD9 TaxID=2055153 RepID=UPI000D1FA592|nr:metalloregulator ArsR/SmtB family transcription factor [Agrobacterium sp. LAD9]